MVGGGRHHTPLPSEDVRRGRSTHTLPPFWPGYKHTLPSKNVESCTCSCEFCCDANRPAQPSTRVRRQPPTTAESLDGFGGSRRAK